VRKQKCGQEAAWRQSPCRSGAASFAPRVLGARGTGSVTLQAPCTRARPARRSCRRAGSHVRQRRVWSAAAGGGAPCIADRPPLGAVRGTLAVHAAGALSGPEAQAAGAPARAQQRSPCPEPAAPSARWVVAWLGARVARARGPAASGCVWAGTATPLPAARLKLRGRQGRRRPWRAHCAPRADPAGGGARTRHASPQPDGIPFRPALQRALLSPPSQPTAQAANAAGCCAQGLKS